MILEAVIVIRTIFSHYVTHSCALNNFLSYFHSLLLCSYSLLYIETPLLISYIDSKFNSGAIVLTQPCLVYISCLHKAAHPFFLYRRYVFTGLRHRHALIPSLTISSTMTQSVQTAAMASSLGDTIREDIKLLEQKMRKLGGDGVSTTIEYGRLRPSSTEHPKHPSPARPPSH